MFSELLVRDYLQNKGLDATLASFCQESKTGQEPSMESWCAMAHDLGLPELLSANDRSVPRCSTIVEVLVRELLRRKKKKKQPSSSEALVVRQRRKVVTTPPAMILPPEPEEANHPKLLKSTSTMTLGPQRRPITTASTTASAQRSKPPKKSSLENWIPMDKRARMLRRNMMVLKHNCDDMNAHACYVANEARHSQLTDLEKNEAAERYGLKRKKRCGLCDRYYSDINLVLKVPYKAVKDLRERWADEFPPHPDHVKLATRVHKACIYDQVPLCVFCTQFVQIGQQEVYRPSMDQIHAEQHRRLRKKQDAAAKAYWDPIKQLQIDRQVGGPLALNADEAALKCLVPPLSPKAMNAMIPMGPP